MLLDGVMGSLFGSPRPTRPSCALIIGCKAWEPASSTVVLRSAQARLLVGTLIELNSIARAKLGQVVPNAHRGRVAAVAFFIEMRRINDIFRFGSESTSAIIGTRARRAAGGSLSSGARSCSKPSAGRSHVVGPRRASSPVFLLPWRQAPRSSCAGLRLGGKPRRRH